MLENNQSGTAAGESAALHLPRVKSMNRAQVKALRAAGLDPALMPDNTEKQEEAKRSADLVEWILDNVYSDINLDQVDYDILFKLALDTYQRTYGGPQAIKNS